MKANTKRFQLPEFKAGMKWSAVNLEYLLDRLGDDFKSSHNPVQVWTAIYFCTKADEPLPHWVIAYLAECSERMMFNEDTSDLRKVLPNVLGFPKRKPGPGKPLRSGPDPDKMDFPMKFVNYMMQGDDPKTARENASSDMSAEFADKYDDKALVQILVDAMPLPETPETAKQWKTWVYRYVSEYFADLTNCDANATEKDRQRLRALVNKAWGR